MGERQRILCWSCQTQLARAELQGNRCPRCGARLDTPAIFVFLVLAFLGTIVGWLGGAGYGALAAAAGWDFDWQTTGQVGAILGAFVLGSLGAVAALVLAFSAGMAGWDKGIRERGEEIRRQRAAAEQAARQDDRSRS